MSNFTGSVLLALFCIIGAQLSMILKLRKRVYSGHESTESLNGLIKLMMYYDEQWRKKHWVNAISTMTVLVKGSIGSTALWPVNPIKVLASDGFISKSVCDLLHEYLEDSVT